MNSVGKRLMVPMGTPLNNEGKINGHLTERLFNNLCEKGVREFLFLGTNGRGMEISPEEQQRFLNIIAEEAANHEGLNLSVVLARKTLLEVEKLLSFINKSGAFDSVTLAPGQRPEESHLDDLQNVLDSTNLPIIGYDLPGDSSLGVDVIDDFFEIDQVAGWKNSSPIPGRQARLHNWKPRDRDFTLWNGSETSFFAKGGEFSDGLVGGSGNILRGVLVNACRTMIPKDIELFAEQKAVLKLQLEVSGKSFPDFLQDFLDFEEGKRLEALLKYS